MRYLKAFFGSVIIICLFIFIVIIKIVFIDKTEINDYIIVKNGDNIIKIYDRYNIPYTVFDKMIYTYFVKRKLPVGKYEYITKISKGELINLLFHNEKGKERITILISEGMTNDKIFKKIEDAGLATTEELLEVLKNYEFYYPHADNFEGYFYPAKYYFTSVDTAKEIVKKILDEFLKQFPPEKYPNKEEFYNNLILASIVEAETQNPRETKNVAGVFKKRLKIDKKLESDATLRYVLENNRHAKPKDLRTNMSEYNTYKHKGLTPTPVCNPSKRTIEDTAEAEAGEYLFFFEHRRKIYYSKTYKEHLRKIREIF